MSNEKTTIKKLWEKHPDARFVLWLDDYYAWFIKFEDPSWLEYPLYTKEFVPVCGGELMSNGDIWIDLEDVDPQKSSASASLKIRTGILISCERDPGKTGNWLRKPFRL